MKSYIFVLVVVADLAAARRFTDAMIMMVESHTESASDIDESTGDQEPVPTQCEPEWASPALEDFEPKRVNVGEPCDGCPYSVQVKHKLSGLTFEIPIPQGYKAVEMLWARPMVADHGLVRFLGIANPSNNMGESKSVRLNLVLRPDKDGLLELTTSDDQEALFCEDLVALASDAGERTVAPDPAPVKSPPQITDFTVVQDGAHVRVTYGTQSLVIKPGAGKWKVEAWDPPITVKDGVVVFHSRVFVKRDEPEHEPVLSIIVMRQFDGEEMLMELPADPQETFFE